MSECRSCHRPVIWVETEARLASEGKKAKPAKKMPVDADPANPGLALRVASSGTFGGPCAACDSAGVTPDGERCPACAGTGLAPEKDRGIDGLGLGNLIFTKTRTGAGTPIVRYIRTGPGLLRSHFASCPDRDQHRRR